MVVAVPVFGQTTATTATLVGAGDIASCATENEADATAKLLGSTLSSLTPDELDQARIIAMGDNAYPRGTRAVRQLLRQLSTLRRHPLRFLRRWWGQYKNRTMPVWETTNT